MGSKLFPSLDKAAAEESPGNFLLFVAEKIGVNSINDMWRLASLKSGLSSQDYDSESKDKDILFISKVTEALRDFHANWADISRFDDCQSCEQLLELLMTRSSEGLLNKAAAFATGSVALPKDWLTQIGSRPQAMAYHSGVFYKDGVLTEGVAGATPGYASMQFNTVSSEDEVLAKMDAKNDPEGYTRWLKLLVFAGVDIPVVVGWLAPRSPVDKLKVNIGGKPVNVQLQNKIPDPESMHKLGIPPERWKLAKERLETIGFTYADKKITDPVSQLPCRLILV